MRDCGAVLFNKYVARGLDAMEPERMPAKFR